MNLFKLVSHWHVNFSRLFCEFCRRLSCDIRASVERIFMCREQVAKVLNMLKKFMRILFAKIFRMIVVRQSLYVRASVANLSPRNCGKFLMRNFRDTHTNVVRMLYDNRATVLRKHANISRLYGEKIKLSDIRTNVVRHSRMSCDTLTNVSRLSHE